MCNLYLALRERINTGKFERSIDIGTRNPFPTFEKHLQKILGWRKDPNTFIEDLLDPLLHKETDELFLAIKEELADLSGDPRWKQHKDGVWVVCCRVGINRITTISRFLRFSAHSVDTFLHPSN